MSFPKFGAEFNDWNEIGKFTLVTKAMVDFETQEIGDSVIFSGILYPMKAQQIALKPEGQRAWKWWGLISEKELSVDDVVEYHDIQYRVFAKTDWSYISGKYLYDLAEAFHDAD